jgi:hypothetical protein
MTGYTIRREPRPVYGCMTGEHARHRSWRAAERCAGEAAGARAVTLVNVRRAAGIAGTARYHATVSREPGGPVDVAAFIGSAYGGPVAMVTEAGRTLVADPGRFGEFGPDWVRRFFASPPGGR